MDDVTTISDNRQLKINICKGLFQAEYLIESTDRLDYGRPFGGDASCSQHEHYKGQSACSDCFVLFILISTQHYNL